MTETNPATYVKQGLESMKALIDGGKFDELFEVEADQAEADGIEPTVGNVCTFACRCIIRILMGDELFYTNLDGLDDEAVDAVMDEARDAVMSTLSACWKEHDAQEDDTETAEE